AAGAQHPRSRPGPSGPAMAPQPVMSPTLMSPVVRGAPPAMPARTPAMAPAMAPVEQPYDWNNEPATEHMPPPNFAEPATGGSAPSAQPVKPAGPPPPPPPPLSVE